MIEEANDMTERSFRLWQEARPILEVLSSLSYRTGELELDRYLQEIACSVSHLLALDWSVVTLCANGQERVVASSLDLGEGEKVYSLHGLLTNTVVTTGKTLTVEDATVHPEYGCPPDGYASYLGVPLRTYQGDVIGTICSFCHQPRDYTLEEVRTVELFAERAATAIDNYTLYQQQQQFNAFLEAEVAKRTEELKTAQARLIERERLAAIGEFAAMIVHEIRNPLTTIAMGLHYFQKMCVSAGDRERLQLILEEAQRLQNLLREILLYAKPQVLQLEAFELNSWLKNLWVSLAEMPEATNRKLEYIPSPSSVTIVADKDKLKQVLINLTRNACEAISSGKTVTCSIEPHPDRIYLQVHNGGDPIPADVIPQLTRPFYSTKSEGTGLGLAIVKRIIEAHGGTLSIQSTPRTGTLIRLVFPVKK
jgi:signal transduction histidine kinase